MSQPPQVQHFEWGQEVAGSASELTSRLGEPVWVPDEWPVAVSGPEFVLMLAPEGSRNQRNGYHLRGLDEAGRLLMVHGQRRSPGNLQSGLRSVEGERFETFARPAGQPVHMVVRTPIFDVHVSGDALSYGDALGLIRGLVEVTADS